MADNQLTFEKDLDNKKIKVTRHFNAPAEDVWSAWTESELLDQWWAPKPWRTETKAMDFREGGHWLYAMVGPEGERHWCRADYKTIDAQKSYTYIDAFCDENGVVTDGFPGMDWNVNFVQEQSGTKVIIDISFKSVADIEKIVEMGFKDGFIAAMSNLDEIFAGK